ncbi:AI-2E family transporter [Pseudoroseicyclus aestuarii]|uniref:Putative PurR-regulated permease PerM n=1 Tax=Pseudoroseicyclus aestuarii TaxID=1795041 RepID=A0A318SVJ4_9RHOB|nr:AI-2E family transporter [Pseudoroseicyclus aestuarii]PYE85512.1 putative PurR-regulated permease PerM [Pseudoroseicyclus aestuarii]
MTDPRPPHPSDRAPSLLAQPERIQAGALLLIAGAIVLFLLVQARFVLISLVTAVVIFALLSDAISLIARARIGPLRIPAWLASAAAVLAVAAALLTVTSVVLSQINSVLVTTLAYADRAPSAVAALFSWFGEEVQGAVYNSVRTVEVGAWLRTIAGQASGLMQGTVLVILFVGFLFAERIWFSTKLTNLIGDPVQAHRVERISASIVRRINRYLLVKTFVSVVTGAMIYIASKAFGLELALALGVLGCILNYIPNLGSIVATGLVTLVGYVQLGDPGATAALFIVVSVIQFFNGSVLDTMLMGRTLRLSSFGIIIFLAFWGAVWGIPGMFLSVPIMVALMIICSEVPSLRPIAVLLSREGLPQPEVLEVEAAARDRQQAAAARESGALGAEGPATVPAGE